MVNSKAGLLITLLDRSGSMTSCKRQTITGMTELLQGQAQLLVNKELDSLKVFIAQFNESPYRPIRADQNILAWPTVSNQLQMHKSGAAYEVLVDMEELNPKAFPSLEKYYPRGGTSLYDSIAYTINLVGANLSNLKEEERPGTILFVIITDGEENSSIEYSGTQVGEMINHQRDRYNWKFMFIGSSEAALNDAVHTLSIDRGSTVSYDSTQEGTTRMYGVLSKAVTATYRGN